METKGHKDTVVGLSLLKESQLQADCAQPFVG